VPERRSVLKQCLVPGQFGKVGAVGVVLSERRELALYQIAVWPQFIDIATQQIRPGGNTRPLTLSSVRAYWWRTGNYDA